MTKSNIQEEIAILRSPARHVVEAEKGPKFLQYRTKSERNAAKRNRRAARGKK